MTVQNIKYIVEGKSELIMHNGSPIDPRSEINLEIKSITTKKGTNRTDKDEERLEILQLHNSMYADDLGYPHIPMRMVRANIEASARKNKEGPSVREGLIVTATKFKYDLDKYGSGTVKDMIENPETRAKIRHATPVTVQRSRIIRIRAYFQLPWSVEVNLETDPELVDLQKLANWIEIGGRRIGIGDWRPEKSGHYGRFALRKGSLQII